MTELVRRASQGDTEAFVSLMEAQKQSFYKIARSFLCRDEDVADAVQETVLICFEKLGQLRQPDYFRTWATRILINVCQDMLRARRRVMPVETVPERAEPDAGQANAEFLALLDSIDEKYRTVLLLYYGEGFSVREISTLLSLKEETVKTRLKRGRGAVRLAYEAE